MKKLICIAFLTVFLFSCAPSYDILSYQEGNISAECVINDKYTVNIIKKEDTRTLEIISPNELSGISFVFNGQEWSAICEDIEIPLDSVQLDGIIALTSIFDLDSGTIGTVSDKGGYGIVSFDMNELCYLVTYNELSLPSHISISGALEFEIEIIAIKTDIV